jgi:hypothetical protein
MLLVFETATAKDSMKLEGIEGAAGLARSWDVRWRDGWEGTSVMMEFVELGRAERRRRLRGGVG